MHQAADMVSPPLQATAAISTWRACLLLVRLRLRRVVNLVLRGFSPWKAAGMRRATGGKLRSGALTALIVLPLVGLQCILMSFQPIANARNFACGPADSFIAIEIMLILLVITAESISFKNRDLSRMDWDVEWLLALPLSTPALLSMKIAEQTIVNIFGWATLFPFLIACCWNVGLRWSAVPAAIAITVPLLLAVGIARVGLETSARKFVPRLVLRNFQAAATLVSLLGMFAMMMPALAASPGHFVWRCGRPIAGIGQWLPTRLIVAMIRHLGMGQASAAGYALAAAAAVGGFVLIGWLLLTSMCAGGLLEASAALQGRRGKATAPPRTRRDAGRIWGGIVGKDLRLLLRDRNMLVGTLVVPVLIILFQFAVNPGIVRHGLASHVHLCAIAFAMGAYVLAFTSVTVLSAEGPSLWMLYCVPQNLDRLLRRKAIMWGCLAGIYTIAVLAYGWLKLPPSLEFAMLSLYVLLGMPLYAMIGSALGVFGCNPLEIEPQRRAKHQQFNLYMLIALMYGGASTSAATGSASPSPSSSPPWASRSGSRSGESFPASSTRPNCRPPSLASPTASSPR